MAVTINADNGAVSGSAGLKQAADSTGVLALQTNGTTAVSISTGQVVTLTQPLPVASGGTAATTSTGTGSVVLSNSPTLVTPALGTPASGTLTNCTFPTLNQSTTGNATTATTATYLSSTAQTNLIVGKTGNVTDINVANDAGSFSARGDATYPASMSFHRVGVYAINVGLSTANNFVIGGWSASSNAFSMTGAGALTMLSNITAYSDERVKTNWRDLQPDFIEQLAKVKHGIYDRTDQVSTQVGVGAQSLRPLMEYAVIENEDGKLSVAYGNAALVAAIKLAQKVVELEERLKAMEAKQ